MDLKTLLQEDQGSNPALFFLFSGHSVTVDEFNRMPALKPREAPLGSAWNTVSPSGQEVAVKKLPAVAGESSEEFFEKVQLLSQFEHVNLGEVVGCYSSGKHRIIIFEHINGLSLDNLLRWRLVEWKDRLSIAKGVARGLYYLYRIHSGEWAPHGNLNSSNVIVTTCGPNQYNPKLVNYGLIHLLPFDSVRQLTVGCTPEVRQNQRPQTSIKTDIYCFGLLLLQLLTGINPKGQEEIMVSGLRETVKSGMNEWMRRMDPSITNDFMNAVSIFNLLKIALKCTEEEAKKRPDMSRLLKDIEKLN